MTETFSVSVDAETKKALRKLADAEYRGNLSALVTDLAEEARRRLAARSYLKRQGIAPLSKTEAAAMEAGLAREVAAARKQRKGRRVA